MPGPRTVVFIHGQRAPEQLQTWLNPLNRRLIELSYSPLDETVDNLVSPSYLDELRAGAEGPAPEVTWTKGDDSAFTSSKSAYLLRRSELARLVARWQEADVNLDLSGGSATPISDFAADWLEAVYLYKNKARHYYAAQRRVLQQLPRSGSAVVVAHSLGSVLAADILTKLPRGLTVEVLLTIGSPLAIGGLGSSSKLELAMAFPYDRVHAWVNVLDPSDVVTIGKGISGSLQMVLDVPIDIGASHTVAAYMSHPVVAALVGHVLFGARGVSASSHVPQRRLHPAWHPLLLNFAYTAQLSAVTEGANWELKRRLDTARNELAERALDFVEQSRAETHEMDRAHEIDDSPLGSGRSPEKSDLLNHAADLVRDTWNDTDLVPLAVTLAMSPPLSPFDIEIDDEHRYRALSAVLNRVRRREGNLTDEVFATAIKESVAEAEKVLNKRGFPWGKVLLFAGLAVLVATGVGLVAAVPAGLAGAAAITATLAAFGPGGMVGGMVTLAVLTGMGTALAGVGLSQLTPGSKPFETIRLQAVQRMAMGSSTELRISVCGMLAVVGVQNRLGFLPSTAVVENTLQKVLAIVSEEQGLHDYVAPDRPGTAEWAIKADILRRALEWLAAQQPEIDASRKVIQTLIDQSPAVTVAEIFREMPTRFNKDAAQGMNAVIQWNLTGDHGGQWHAIILDGALEVKKGTHSSPNMVMTMAATDYVDLTLGELNGQIAFLQGKLKIAGDMDLAMKMADLFSAE